MLIKSPSPNQINFYSQIPTWNRFSFNSLPKRIFLSISFLALGAYCLYKLYRSLSWMRHLQAQPSTVQKTSQTIQSTFQIAKEKSTISSINNSITTPPILRGQLELIFRKPLNKLFAEARGSLKVIEENDYFSLKFQASQWDPLGGILQKEYQDPIPYNIKHNLVTDSQEHPLNADPEHLYLDAAIKIKSHPHLEVSLPFSLLFDSNGQVQDPIEFKYRHQMYQLSLKEYLQTLHIKPEEIIHFKQLLLAQQEEDKKYIQSIRENNIFSHIPSTALEMKVSADANQKIQLKLGPYQPKVVERCPHFTQMPCTIYKNQNMITIKAAMSGYHIDSFANGHCGVILDKEHHEVWIYAKNQSDAAFLLSEDEEWVDHVSYHRHLARWISFDEPLDFEQATATIEKGILILIIPRSNSLLK